jgi:hypothetical protein
MWLSVGEAYRTERSSAGCWSLLSDELGHARAFITEVAFRIRRYRARFCKLSLLALLLELTLRVRIQSDSPPSISHS